MPSPVVTRPALITDPGWLYWAPLGTALPASLLTGATAPVTGSQFTDVWPTPWVWLGLTDAGSDWHYNMAMAQVDAAELYDPVAWRTTGRTSSVTFALQNYTATNVGRALNGATMTVTGTTTTQLTKVTPVQPGGETRFMIGWESTSSDVRKVAYQCVNSGDVAEMFKKAPAKVTIPFNCNFELPSTGVNPVETWFAGTVRG